MKRTEFDMLKVVVDTVVDTKKAAVLGKVYSGYTSGRPRIVFDGEAVASTKTYSYLSSYTPVANDRVLLVRAGSTFVVVGKVL